MNVAGPLLEDLRGLARKYGAPMLVAGCVEFVKEFAVKGVEAEIAERRGDPKIKCPTCRQRQAMLDEAKAVLRPPRAAEEAGD